ncbi:MAG TPA: S9 family peptidase [Fimbriimonadaceae bacterium]|nr:S9 family peptidase [Fimbriimonadaceae bacterium]
MPKRAITPEDLLAITIVADPQISPDGSRILFAKKDANDKNKVVSNLFTVDLGGHVQQWTQGEGGAGMGRWSSDGSQIAFISGRDEKRPQIFVMSTSGGEAKKLTSLDEGTIGEIKWSPDGRKIAYSYRRTSDEWTQAAAKSRQAAGLSTPPRVTESTWYRFDGDGYFLSDRFAIFIVDVATGESALVYDKAPMDQFSFDWAPNSNEIVVVHSANKRPDFDPANDQLYRVDLSGQAWKLEGPPAGPKYSVRWSPDGKSIAYLGHSDSEDPWGVRNIRLWIVAADGGEARCLTSEDDFCLDVATLGDCKESPDGVLCWSPDSKAIYLSIGWHGAVQLGYVEVEKGGVQLLTEGCHTIAVGNVSRDGEKIACLTGDALRPSEVAVYDLSKHPKWPDALTRFNQDLLDELKLSEPEELWLDTPDGTKVHAWVMKPVDYLEPRRYPAVLEIHGGPHTQYGWTFFHEFQLLAAQGYVVVYSNPRGSKGYGEAHCAAIRGDWGNTDWIDIETVMRWMQHQPYIHPGQMGVMGGSYGGYMTNWVVSHTNDFKAAITDRCVSNLVSFSGSSDFPQVADTYWKGVFYGDIENLWRCSPIAHFQNVKTPMLIIHSEGDLRCNIEQSEQVFMALKQLDVEARFVRYPVETSHGMSRNGPPDMRLHRLGEIVNWWKKHLA